HVIPEREPITALLCPSYDGLKQTALNLQSLGLLQPPPFKEYPTNLFRPLVRPKAVGRLEKVRRVNADNLLVSGWAMVPSQRREADAVLLTYEQAGSEPRLFGVADYRDQRPDLQAQMGKNPYYYCGWHKEFSLRNLPPGGLVLRAWVYDVERQTVVPLDGSESADN